MSRYLKSKLNIITMYMYYIDDYIIIIYKVLFYIFKYLSKYFILFALFDLLVPSKQIKKPDGSN